MKRNVCVIILLLVLGWIIQSCSLFKVNTDFGGKPLPSKDLNARVAVRAYAANFTDLVAQAADSVIAMVQRDPALGAKLQDSIQLAAIRWKRNASAACMNVSLSATPQGALLNTWVLLKGMDHLNWEAFLGKYGFVGERTSEFMLNKYQGLVASFLKTMKFEQMQQFVDSVTKANPLDRSFQTEDYTYQWFRYSGVPDSLAVATVGSISEVIADLNDRVGKYSINVSNQLEWGKQQLGVQVNAFLADSTYKAGLDSLNRSLGLLKGALKSAPEKIDSLILDVNMRLGKLIGLVHDTANATLYSAFAHIAEERKELMAYFSAEREVVMRDGKVLLDDLIKNLLIYFVLFVLLLVGVPFYIGYKIGRRSNSA